MRNMSDKPVDAPEGIDNGRRTLFALAAVSPLVLLGLATRPAAAQAPAPACFDLAKLPMSQRSIRTSLGFKMQYTDPAKKCGTCSFYTPGTGDCGKCQIFDNGPTTANSTCTSWAKKS